jgi:DNA invertase Pin-like site-specific DNA recombinase
MKASIYARVSTEDQHCEMQLTELGGYTERMGWPAVPEKASGKAGTRLPVLDQLLADARLRKFGVVLCWTRLRAR